MDLRPTLALAASVLLALIALPAAAHAGPVSRTAVPGGFQIAHAARPLAEDVFILTHEGNDVTFSIGDTLEEGPGCDSPASRTISCSATNVSRVVITLEDQDDAVAVGGLFGGGVFGFPITIDGGSGSDLLAMGTEPDTMTGGTGNDRLLAGDGNDSLTAGDGDDDLIGSGGSDLLRGDAGADELQPGSGADDIRGGTGADIAFFESGNDTITLDERPNDGMPGEGDNLHGDVETVDGGSGNDHMVGDDGVNVLRGGAGADDISGGGNFDQVAYPFAGDQRVTLDNLADDGAVGEGDNVRSDIESVAAGPGNDTLIGNGFANTLDGGDGDDELRGGGGVDTFLGGAGNDVIQARDGLPERVDCGIDGGRATVDTIDTVVACTTVDASDALVPDLDRDGVDRPPRGEDCNDANPAVRPGAAEVPDNAVDENCDGRAAFDRDGDGVLAPPAGDDCDDGNARIKPRAREVRGNRVDENCDGVAARFALLRSSVGAVFVIGSGSTRVDDVFVRRARKGSTVRLRCTGCGRRAKTVRVERNRRKLTLRRQVRGLELRPGARIEVRVARRATIGLFTRFKMRAGKPPLRTDACLFPGRKRPRRCPG
jgi:hypothetical protein